MPVFWTCCFWKFCSQVRPSFAIERSSSSFWSKAVFITPPSRRCEGQSGSMAASRRSASSSMLSQRFASWMARSAVQVFRVSRSWGIFLKVAARASRSRGKARLVLIRAAILSVSAREARRFLIEFSLSGDCFNSSTVSCLSSISPRSQRGMQSQFLKSLAPGAVRVSSRQ